MIDGQSWRQIGQELLTGFLSNWQSRYTPVQVANFLFGHNRFNPNQAVPLMLDKLQEALPADEYARVTQLIKDGILARAFTNRQGSVSRKAVVDNFNDVFEKQKAIISKLFSEDELARLRQFREDVLPTVWAETRGNPSGTSYALISAATGRAFKQVPVGLWLKGITESASLRRIEATDKLEIATPVFSGHPNTAPESGARGSEEGQFKAFTVTARIEQRMHDISANDVSLAPMFDPLPMMPTGGGSPAMMSPTLIPSEDDRQIAMRRQRIAGWCNAHIVILCW